MAKGRNVTPLVALDALAIDVETTGLDPAKARIVEIAAVRLSAGKLDAHPVFHHRIRPGEPIPAAATGIHGIDDAAVAAAPVFAELWPEISALIGGAILRPPSMPSGTARSISSKSGSTQAPSLRGCAQRSLAGAGAMRMGLPILRC